MSDFLYLAFATSLVFVAIIAILLSFKGSYLKKAIITLLLTLAAIGNYRALNYFKGQSKVLQVTYEKALVLGFYPDKKNEVIYIWLKIKDTQVPITYQIPYTSETRSKLSRLREKFKGRPYPANIKVKVDPAKPFKNGSSIDIEEYRPGVEGLPLKKENQDEL